MELKAYKLVMIKSNNQSLSNGKFVKDYSLIDGIPEDESTYGYLTNINDKHNIEISYGDNGKGLCCIDTSCNDMDTLLEVVEPYLISINDSILKNDLVMVEGRVMQSMMNLKHPINCFKIVALPQQIGWVYYEGSPHDRVHSYKGNGVYLEELHQNVILDILNNDGKVLVDVEEICPHYDGKHIGKDCSCKSGFIHIPKLYEGKIIFHTYEFTPKETANYLIIK